MIRIKNNLIADFMGYESMEGEYKHPRIEVLISGVGINSMCYSNWDWLIPVVKKIREVINTKLSVDDFDLKRGYEQSLNPYNYSTEQIYKSTIEFIKWYNTTDYDKQGGK